jgi:hypothetical protein
MYSFTPVTSALDVGGWSPRPSSFTPWYPLYENPIRKRKHAWQDQSSSLSTYVKRSFYPKSGHPDSKNKKFSSFKFFLYIGVFPIK